MVPPVCAHLPMASSPALEAFPNSAFSQFLLKSGEGTGDAVLPRAMVSGSLVSVLHRIKDGASHRPAVL